MTSRHTIVYWLSTGFLAFGMVAQGVAQLSHTKGYVDIITHLGYPAYFLNIIGVWKIVGVVAILIPGLLLAKEWAYAGFFFVMSGAAFSHLAAGDSGKAVAPAVVLLVLIVTSWYFRPLDRKIHSRLSKETA
ncbi:DoxX family protein [Hymenobacter sp.]|uniref:DoxX family protein n=1 Tax=Hymenobacter sp. TaxID=1898978 RepID=UPI00286AD7EF|nr:DoxX family protein [Hymenobacter sp.]